MSVYGIACVSAETFILRLSGTEIQDEFSARSGTLVGPLAVSLNLGKNLRPLDGQA